MPNDKEHESYGMIGISNITSSSSQPMFGSSIKHDRWVTIKIKRAILSRGYSQDKYFGKDRIIEVSLSAAQFAEFITTPNRGDGVPCTINHVEGTTMKPPPYVSQNELVKEELESDFKKVIIDGNSLIKRAEALLLTKGHMKASEKSELLDKLRSLVQHIKSNMPFMYDRYTKAMDKTVSAAKTEIESFYTQTIKKLGEEALEGKKLLKPKILETRVDGPPVD